MAALKNDPEIWLALAELFFLDTEHTDTDHARVAALLRSKGWSREETKETLIGLIAPYAGANLGYGIYPVNGLWSGFDKEKLIPAARASLALRMQSPPWMFLVSDWWMTRLLTTLGMDAFLARLDAPQNTK
jgi:hypothetical protein